MKEAIVLQKGESIKFLDYTIKNCENNDGMVLLSKKDEHCGNYGIGTKEKIEYCKKDALLHFMIMRPAIFAHSIINKMRRPESGTYHEYFLLSACLKKEGIEMPKEITCGDGMNCMIFFKDKPLISKPKKVADEKETEQTD